MTACPLLATEPLAHRLTMASMSAPTGIRSRETPLSIAQNPACTWTHPAVPTGQSNTVTGNTFLESAYAGILDDTSGTGGNTITDDTYLTVPFTLTSSTSKCTVAAGTAMLAKAKAMPKVSPAR